MNRNAYIDFENEENYYKLYYGIAEENNDLLIRKGNGVLKRMLQSLEQDTSIDYILFVDVFGKPYNTLYVDDDMVILTREEEFITINLDNGRVQSTMLDWWINDTEDFIRFVEKILVKNELKNDDETISSIILRFENQ